MWCYKATIGLLAVALCAPVAALDLQGGGIALNNRGLEQTIDPPASLYIGNRDWWNQAWRTQPGIDLSSLRGNDPDNRWPAYMNLSRSFPVAGYSTTINAGIGLQPIDFSSRGSYEGLRLSLGGQIGIGNGFSFYGESAWVPGLLESAAVDELSGMQFETGVILNPLPNLSIRAAYRRYSLDYTLTGGVDEYATSQGIMIGTGLHW